MVGKFDNSFVAVFSRNDCGFAFTCLAVKRPTNLAVLEFSGEAVLELSGKAVHELSN